jgi:hypothetical protein
MRLGGAAGGCTFRGRYRPRPLAQGGLPYAQTHQPRREADRRGIGRIAVGLLCPSSCQLRRESTPLGIAARCRPCLNRGLLTINPYAIIKVPGNSLGIILAISSPRFVRPPAVRRSAWMLPMGAPPSSGRGECRPRPWLRGESLAAVARGWPLAYGTPGIQEWWLALLSASVAYIAHPQAPSRWSRYAGRLCARSAL